MNLKGVAGLGLVGVGVGVGWADCLGGGAGLRPAPSTAEFRRAPIAAKIVALEEDLVMVADWETEAVVCTVLELARVPEKAFSVCFVGKSPKDLRPARPEYCREVEERCADRKDDISFMPVLMHVGCQI